MKMTADNLMNDYIFEEGYDSFLDSKNILDNPYLVNSPYYISWNAGYICARDLSDS